VWAEGSAYLLGVPEALRAWRGFLKHDGALGFTELAWLRPDVPDACREFFAAEYPQMCDVPSLRGIASDCGYDVVGHFTLPESSWWENDYRPLERRLEGYGGSDDEVARSVLAMVRREIETYRQYARWYGYEFSVLRPAR
jgi:hypothetical protein